MNYKIKYNKTKIGIISTVTIVTAQIITIKFFLTIHKYKTKKIFKDSLILQFLPHFILNLKSSMNRTY